MKKLLQIFNSKGKTIIDVLFIFILSLTPLLWFRDGAIFVGHDDVYGLDPRIFLDGRLFTWIGQEFGRSQALIMGTIPVHFIDALPFMVGFSLQTTQKLVYIFWFLMTGLSVYILASTINPKSRIFKFTAVLFYQFNFFVLQGWFIGERTKISAYIALPLILSVFIRVYKGEMKLAKAFVLNAIIFFIFNAGGLYGVPLYGGLLVSLGIFTLFFSILEYSKKRYHIAKKIIFLTLLTIFGFILVNSYYLFPAASQVIKEYRSGVGSVGGISGLTSWADEISANTSFINIFRLQGISDWYDNPDHPYARIFLTNPFLIGISFIWPLLVFLAIYSVKKKRGEELILFFSIVYLVGIFFAAGTHPPLGALYAILMRYIPGFIIFRSPYFKFAPAIFLSTTFLIAFLIDRFNLRAKKILFILFCLLLLGYHFPYFTGNFFAWKKGFSTRVQIPEYIFQFGSWLNTKNTDNGRILLLPPNSPDLQYSMYTWGYLSFQAIPTLLSNKSAVINNDALNDKEKKLVLLLYSAIANRDKNSAIQLASLLRVKYFVLQTDSIPDLQAQVPLNPALYKNILENDFNLKPEEKFGKWIAYKFSDAQSPTIFVEDSINIIDSPVEDVGKYYNFSTDQSAFIRKEDLTKNISLATIQTKNFYTPDCINCITNSEPLIQIPERSILPDSPLYPLVLWMEKLGDLRKGDAKSRIYNYVGVSLKRISEINGLITDNKKITDDSVGRYLATLQSIKDNFKLLNNYEDKLQIGGDLNQYMTKEENYLSEISGTYIVQGQSIAVLDKLIQGIANVVKTIDPYLFKLDPVNNRLYKVSLDNSGNYSLYLKKNDFQSLSKDGKLNILIDNNISKEVKLDSNPTDDWFSFGNIKMEQGDHYILLSFPELPNLMNDLKSNRTEFNITGDNNCFTSRINNFRSGKIYKIKVNYKNDFSNDLLFYIWELKEKERVLTDIVRFQTGLTTEEYNHVIKSYGDTLGIEVGICSKSLSQDVLQKKISVKADEIIYPSIFITPGEYNQNNQGNVSFTAINPTKYNIKTNKSSKPFALIFAQEFSSGWNLSKFEKTHVQINGYANGWIIDGKQSYDLTLEYKPQEAFHLGVAITLVSLIGGLGYLIAEKIKRIKKYG